MGYSFNHVHLKAPDPKATADWYVKAFNFKILRDEVRPSGDRFLRCQTEDGVIFNISAARTGEQRQVGRQRGGGDRRRAHLGAHRRELVGARSGLVRPRPFRPGRHDHGAGRARAGSAQPVAAGNQGREKVFVAHDRQYMPRTKPPDGTAQLAVSLTKA